MRRLFQRLCGVRQLGEHADKASPQTRSATDGVRGFISVEDVGPDALSEQLETLASAIYQDRITALELKVFYLYQLCLRQDEKIRDLLASSPALSAYQSRTHAAFEHKWLAFPDGRYSPNNPAHRRQALREILELTGLPEESFAGMRILDAGCGDGRLSVVLCELGANVVSADVSTSAVERVAGLCADYPNHEPVSWDALAPADIGDFDIVLCLGVAHHTGDTQKTLHELANRLRPSGYLCVMLYGYPSFEQLGDLYHDSLKDNLHFALRGIASDEAKGFLAKRFDAENIRALFDGAAPMIEDHYTRGQAIELLQRCGLTDIQTVDAGGQHHRLRARKPASPPPGQG